MTFFFFVGWGGGGGVKGVWCKLMKGYFKQDKRFQMLWHKTKINYIHEAECKFIENPQERESSAYIAVKDKMQLQNNQCNN